MSKITLNNVTTFVNDATAVNTVNTNSATLQTAFDNTLSRDGTQPNQMSANIDMNNNRLLNLPAPSTGAEPLRLQDAATLNGGGTIATIPAGGTTGQVLSKASNANYDATWQTNGIVSSVGLSMPADFTVTGSPITTTGTLTAAYATTPTGTGALVKATSPTLVTPTLGVATVTSLNKMNVTAPATGSTLAVADGKTFTANNTLTLGGSDGTAITFQGTDTYIGRATTDTLTNKTINTAGTGNHIQISGVDITRGQILGEASTGSAAAGNIGEFITSIGSGVALTSGSGFNACAITITPGDWDIWGYVNWTNSGATTYTMVQCSIGSTNGTITTQMTQIFVTTAGATYSLPPPMQRFSVSANTTIFLVGNQTFTGGAPTGGGAIYARRAR